MATGGGVANRSGCFRISIRATSARSNQRASSSSVLSIASSVERAAAWQPMNPAPPVMIHFIARLLAQAIAFRDVCGGWDRMSCKSTGPEWAERDETGPLGPRALRERRLT